VKTVGERFPIDVYDPHKPLGEQFDGIDVVVDANGAAGVKLWQVCTNGLDHVDVAYIVSKEIPFAIPLDNKPPCRSRSM